MSEKIFEFAIIGAGLTGSAAAKYICESDTNTVLIGPSQPNDKKIMKEFMVATMMKVE